MADAKKKVGLSFEPELIGEGPGGEHVIKDANHFIMLGSASNGTIFYIPRENAYYANPGGQPNVKKILDAKMPFLRWDFDVMEEEEVSTTDSAGKPRTVKLPAKSSFPPTPENIAAKRTELMAAAVAKGEVPDMKKIYAATSPKELTETPEFLAELDQRTAPKKIADRINRNNY
jgi:hypothetical protein